MNDVQHNKPNKTKGIEMEDKNWLSAKNFGKKMNPPVSRFRVVQLCNQGRIPGAIKLSGKTGAWVIPESALKHDDRKIDRGNA